MIFAQLIVLTLLYDVQVVAAPAASAVQTTVTQDVSQYGCKIRTTHGMGSGVITSSGVLTCWHVVNGEDQINVTNCGETAKAVILSKDIKHDLALLGVAWKSHHQPVPVASVGPTVGDQLTSCGRCKDGTLNVENHQCLSRGNGQVRFKNASNSGRSGGGMFNTDCRLIGIVTGNSVDVEPYTGLATGVAAIRGLVPDEDDRPVVWMFTDPGPGCIPCNSAKAFFKTHGRELPFKVIFKAGMPDWLDAPSFPTFFWGVKTAAGTVQHKQSDGWKGRDDLVATWMQSIESENPNAETSIEKSYRAAELKIGHAAQKKLGEK